MANVWTTQGVGDTLHEVDPISRIEGHLGVKVSVSGGIINDANAHGNLWRGFENFLLGRDVNDAITFTQRICGVCPVPHGMTATYAVDNVLGYSRGHITFKTAIESGRTYGVPEKAVLIRNLVLGTEFLMSSITHFYHLAAPSYVQGPAIPPWTPYFDSSYYVTQLRSGGAALPNINQATMKLWDAVIYSYVKALKIRRMCFEAGALFAGRMPMTSCYVGGGVTNESAENLATRITQFKTIMTAVSLFVVQEYVPIALALGALQTANDNTGNSGGGAGAGLGRFLAWGGFPNLDDSLTFPGGVFEATHAYQAPGALGSETVRNFRVLNKTDVYNKFLDGGTFSVSGNLTEDITHSRYAVSSFDTAVYTSGSAYPGDVARTKPSRAKAAAYSYMKAPRWNGAACEVGPLARMAVAGYYPVDGTTTLASAFPGYLAIYTSTSGSLNAPGLGLDVRPGIISADVVAGLANEAPALSGGLGGSFVATVQGYILGCKGGLSTMDRLRARALESLVVVQAIMGAATKNDTNGTLSFAANGWIDQLSTAAAATWRARPGAMPAAGPYTTAFSPYGTNHGWGGTEAPRGALMHQTTVQNGKILKYQCIVPTTWNGSPKDSGGNRGAIEQAMIGAPFSNAGTTFTKQNGTASATTAGGVEVLRIAQSFDPCIACAVH
jgi:Ni,Fe-hydrogenase I large subunit